MYNNFVYRLMPSHGNKKCKFDFDFLFLFCAKKAQHNKHYKTTKLVLINGKNSLTAQDIIYYGFLKRIDVN